MAVIKWDPLGNIATLQDRINKLFDESFPCQTSEIGNAPPGDWTPNVDIFETDQGVIVAVDLPGVEKEKVAVEIKKNLLAISGERTPAAVSESAAYYRQERPYGRFARSFTLHAMIQPESIKATFKNGVLTVEIPKPAEDAPKRISVDIT